jgi:predicted AlkP superfamily phosphohydrolase/phosphomutase
MCKLINKKVLVLALDSATFDFILPMIERGELPNFDTLLKNGTYGFLNSTIPPHSAPAWITFMTGLNPGNHGIMSFSNIDLTDYSFFGNKIVNSSMYKGKTIFDYLGKKGKRVISFGLPTTYPPWEINGIMMSGNPTPDERIAFTYPEQYGNRFGHLLSMRTDIKLASSYDVQIKEYYYENQRITDIAIDLLRNEPWDLFVYFNGILDSVQHTFWQFKNKLAPTFNQYLANKYANVIEDMYKAIDYSIGRVLDAVDSDTTVIVMSDHGSGPRPLKVFNLNFWLKKKGYLNVTGGLKAKFSSLNYKTLNFLKAKLPVRDLYRKYFPNYLKRNISSIKQNIGAVDWEKTSAYRVELLYPYEGINLNVKDRQQLGFVDISEYESFRTKLICELEELKKPNNGEIIQELYRKEDLYSGPFMKNMPDIIIKINEEYEGGSGVQELICNVSKAGFKKWGGYHLPQGVFIASGNNIKKGIKIDDVSIANVAPTILYILKEPIIKHMDGRVITHIFQEEVNDLKYDEFDYVLKDDTQEVLSEDEERKKALKALGYMD